MPKAARQQLLSFEIPCAGLGVEYVKRIAVIHPEGNFLNNPNLLGIVEILCEQGYFVDIYSLSAGYNKDIRYQSSPCNGCSIILRESFPLSSQNRLFKFLAHIARCRDKRWMARHIGALPAAKLFFRHFEADLVIGVDRDGIIEAGAIANATGIPYGLISYEIFFEDETSKKFKRAERKACNNISFSVCQDNQRSALLAEENRLDADSIISIPVAGRGIRGGPRRTLLHDRLGIAKDKHIALYMGSVTKATGLEEILASVQAWPDEWVLVIHPRYGLDNTLQKIYHKHKGSKKVFFSLDPATDHAELSDIVKSASVGFAVYHNIARSPYWGKNIETLGLASGKASTFFQHGVPVITNKETGMLADIVREKKLGKIFNNNTQPIPTPELESYSDRCYKYFEKRLDLDHTIIPLTSRISELLQK